MNVTKGWVGVASVACGLGLAAALWIAPATAWAQADPDAAATAQALHEQAMKHMEQKDYAQACPKLEEVTRLVPEGLGAKLSLAECYEGQGRYASAFTMFRVVEGSAAAQGQRERSENAGKRAAAIASKVSKLTIEVPANVKDLPGLEVKRAGKVIPRGSWGVAIPVDKGEYEVVATATGKKTWSAKVVIKLDGESAIQPVGPLEEAGPGDPKDPPKDDPKDPPKDGQTTTTTPQPKDEPSSGGLGGQQIAGIVVGASGIVALAIGGAFGGIALSKQGESNEPGNCDENNQCSPTGLDLRQEALTASYVSTAMIVVGGALAATGVVVFLTAPSNDEAKVGLRVGPGAVGVWGTF